MGVTAEAWALRLLHEAPARPTAWPPEVEPLAVAWALKELCYQSWNIDPQKAARAADTLGALQRLGQHSDQSDAIAGLAAWTAGIACLTRGQMLQAVQAFDTAAAALRAAGQPDAAAQTQVPKIMALSMLGRHDEAAACGQAAQRELLSLGNVRAAARVSLNLGNLLGRRDAYAQAAQRYREATVLFARLGDHEQSVLADIGLAWAWASLGDFDEALRIYARARMRAGNQGLQLQQALVSECVAKVELARGRYPQALAGLESACRSYHALGVPQYLAIGEKQLADAYLEVRLLPEAQALFDTAVAQFQALAMPDEQAWALSQSGRALALLGRGLLAEAAFGQAAALFDTHANAVGAASVALARAELALSVSDGAGALRWAEAAGTGFRAAAQADGQSRAEVLMAEALLQAGQTDAAHGAFKATLLTAQALQQVQIQVRSLTGLGLCARAQGRNAQARQAFESAIDLFEDQRRALPGDELRRAFLSDHLRPYQEMLRLALQAGDAAQVLLELDRCRARALSDRLDDGEPVQAQDAAPELRVRLNWLIRRVRELQDEGSDSAALNAELLQTERDLLERARRQRLAMPVRPGPAAGADFDLSSLQDALCDGDALVEYGVLDGEIFACVVTRQGVHLQRAMAAWATVIEALDAARFQIEALRHGSAPVLRHMPVLTARAQARLRQLHALVWAPLAEALQGCGRVIVVPHAQLGVLPFAALSGDDQALPLGEALQLALAPSARMALRGLQRPPVPARTVLALGESSRLPHAAQEAQDVVALFEQGLVFVGARADLAALRAHAPAADVLHLACHAQFRSDNPRFSALHLADGTLTVDEAEALGLRACTVVLSACETALADSGSGDERVGLVRAFLVAGASRVLASLWPVDDAVTAGFMAAFYGSLRQGQPPAAALARAQSVTRLAHPHPCFWGAFSLYGAW